MVKEEIDWFIELDDDAKADRKSRCREIDARNRLVFAYEYKTWEEAALAWVHARNKGTDPYNGPLYHRNIDWLVANYQTHKSMDVDMYKALYS